MLDWVCWVRSSSSPATQGSPSTMTQLTTGGKKRWYPHSWSVSKRRTYYHGSNLYLQRNKESLWHSHKEARKQMWHWIFSWNFREAWAFQHTFSLDLMSAVRCFNTRGPSKLYVKFTLSKTITPSWGQAGGGRFGYSQGASFSRSVYSITLSTEIIWKTYDIAWVRNGGFCLWMLRDNTWNVLLLYLVG